MSLELLVALGSHELCLSNDSQETRPLCRCGNTPLERWHPYETPFRPDHRRPEACWPPSRAWHAQPASSEDWNPCPSTANNAEAQLTSTTKLKHNLFLSQFTHLTRAISKSSPHFARPRFWKLPRFPVRAIPTGLCIPLAGAVATKQQPHARNGTNTRQTGYCLSKSSLMFSLNLAVLP